MIRSEPEGARVRVNGVLRGVTPLEIPFNDYGVVRLETEPLDVDGSGFPDFEGVRTPFPLSPPWYQWFPFDFVSDNLWPGTLHVHREVCIVLPVALDPDSEADYQAMKAKVPGIRIRAEKMRVEEEAFPPSEKR